MGNERFTLSETDIAVALRGLREALGRSQDVMAQMLGCSLPAYQKWEMGTLVPGGEWLIKMLQLCPDEETRNAFRIRAERRASNRQKIEPHPAGRLSAEERRDYRRMAREAVEIMFECGEGGVAAADARLRDFAMNMEQAAQYYRQKVQTKRTNRE
ncbi:MAG TPA: helix-turn-helix transcriptional regulator [Terriglobia bacterium]|nr:helix-turn-helix transcriptional regulator [Terriglobia bacterium]